MPFFYQQPTPLRPELLSQGIAQLGRGMEMAGQGIGEAIRAHKEKLDEQKAYAGLAKLYGLDPKTVTKEQVQAAMLAQTIQQATQDRSAATRARAAFAPVLQAYASNIRNRPSMPASAAAGPANPLAGKAGAGPDPAAAWSNWGAAGLPIIPGQDRSTALMNAIAAHPEILGDPSQNPATEFGDLSRAVGATGGAELTSVGGRLPVLTSGNGRVSQLSPASLAQLGLGAPGFNPSAGSKSIRLDDGTELQVPYFQTTPHSAVPLTAEIPGNPRYSANRGLLPPGTTTRVQDGELFATTPDGWEKSLGRPAKDQSMDDFRRVFGGLQNQTGTNAAPPAALSAAPQWKTGERVTQNGVTYEWDGEQMNPVEDEENQ